MEFAHQAVGFGDLKKQHFLNARKFNQAATELLAEQDYEPALQNALDSLNLLYGLTGPESVSVGRQVLQIADIREKLGLHEEATSDIHRGIRILRGPGIRLSPAARNGPFNFGCDLRSSRPASSVDRESKGGDPDGESVMG